LQEKPHEIVVPDYIEDPLMREEAYQMALFAEKYQTLNLLETPLIPDPINRGPNFDERLREAMDVD
jgi:hypothetical protein